MTRFAKLLAKLEKLDPETWEKLEKMSGSVDVEYEDYCIQGILQDAIDEHDWKWSQENLNGYYAVIWPLGTSIGKDSEGDISAEALLAAYVAALEAAN